MGIEKIRRVFQLNPSRGPRRDPEGEVDEVVAGKKVIGTKEIKKRIWPVEAEQQANNTWEVTRPADRPASNATADIRKRTALGTKTIRHSLQSRSWMTSHSLERDGVSEPRPTIKTPASHSAHLHRKSVPRQIQTPRRPIQKTPVPP